MEICLYFPKMQGFREKHKETGVGAEGKENLPTSLHKSIFYKLNGCTLQVQVGIRMHPD